MTTLQTGALLHQQRYRIRQPLGRGGMGAVYLAEDLNLAGRLVAVKENLNNSEEAQRQFRREAVLLANLRHPNLPQVIDFFVDARGRQYLVMEYVPGENMQEVIAAQGALPIDEALDCIDQVMQAVAYMHRQRDPATGRARAIIHRDIKPANIKRTPEGRYVLVDFGIAKAQSDTAVTALSARALTPGYAPIEQYHGGTDERSDVYALGATLYALVTGKAPPSATSMAAGAPLPPPRNYNSKIPATVNKAIERAMRVNVGERYQQVTALYGALFNRPVPTTPRATTPLPGQRQTAQRPQRATLWLGGIIIVATVLVIWTVLSTRGSNEVTGGGQLITLTTPVIVVSPLPVTSLINVTPTVTLATTTVPSPSNTATTTSPSATSTATTEPTAPGDEQAQAVSTVSLVGTPTPPATSTRIPTATPLATATSATATPAPINTPTATAAQRVVAPQPTLSAATSNTGGPRAATILQPLDNTSSNNPTLFSWQPDGDLAPGQEYEVVFWNPQNQTINQAVGWVRSATATSVVIPADRRAPGAYNWALVLVMPEPYQRLRMLAGPFTFAIPGSGGESGGGESRPEPNPTDPPQPPEKPVSDPVCDPAYPCP